MHDVSEVLLSLVPEETNLVPCFVEHDSTANGNTSLVSKEILKGLFVVVPPMPKEGANVEEAI